jgi:hypothetical protein
MYLLMPSGVLLGLTHSRSQAEADVATYSQKLQLFAKTRYDLPCHVHDIFCDMIRGKIFRQCVLRDGARR